MVFPCSVGRADVEAAVLARDEEARQPRLCSMVAAALILAGNPPRYQHPNTAELSIMPLRASSEVTVCACIPLLGTTQRR
jgi:hypothetical protein